MSLNINKIERLAQLVAFGILLSGCTNGSMPMQMARPDLGVMPDLVDCKADPVACGLCATDNDCKAKNPDLPRCEVGAGRCVKCLPASDNCGNGMLCIDKDGFGTYECTAVCRIDADCIKLMGGGVCCAGACRNTTNDTKNCGGCGRLCPSYPNAANVCSGGTCTMGACTPGFADCNKRDTDGCEASISDDLANCGACGNACPRIVGGTTVCAMGACSSSCRPGQLDCDNDLKNGCEIDSTNDPKNCGACGTTCTAPKNAVPACDAGKCAFRCLPHFFDCNNDPKDGCEVDATVDPNNCGHCGSICPPLPNAQAACVNSLCTAGQCANGFGDCDRRPGNGCETPLATDPSNCGACGRGCKSVNGTAVCAMGTCTLTCNQGYTDCNGDAGDGCEANFASDPKNCGACGKMCQVNEICSSGTCIAPTCTRMGWFTGSSSWTCPQGYRLPLITEYNAVAPCITQQDQTMFGYYQDIGLSVGGCNCKWNNAWCGQPSIETMRQGRACGDYAQLMICIK